LIRPVGNYRPRFFTRSESDRRRILATINNVIYRDGKFSIAVLREVMAQNPILFPETRSRRRKKLSRPINHR